MGLFPPPSTPPSKNCVQVSLKCRPIYTATQSKLSNEQLLSGSGTVGIDVFKINCLCEWHGINKQISNNRTIQLQTVHYNVSKCTVLKQNFLGGELGPLDLPPDAYEKGTLPPHTQLPCGPW